MRGLPPPEQERFSDHIDRDQRLRPDHPRRQIAARIDVSLGRPGSKGLVSLDPAIPLVRRF